MVSTRRQSLASSSPSAADKAQTKPASKRGGTNAKKPTSRDKQEPEPGTGSKRDAEKVDNMNEETTEEPPKKKAKADDEQEYPVKHDFQTGTIERGYIYFFYRPKVELEDVHSIDEVQRFHMLLVPRPPEFSVHTSGRKDGDTDEMQLISEGADAVPAPQTVNESKKFRLIPIGKKSLQDPEAGGSGKGGGRKQVFWATVATIGDDLKKLQDGLGEKTYETKTRGIRHQGPARLAARGAYAIVNSEGRTPSSRETHFGYHLSHPIPSDTGEVQEVLGIHSASSFVLQAKNPLAPNTGSTFSGFGGSRTAEYPEEIMKTVFGKGGGRGRESYGLRFAPVERADLLDYENVELLFIAARSGDEGLETSLGEGRGRALTEAEAEESKESIDEILKELAIDAEKIPAEPLKGDWA